MKGSGKFKDDSEASRRSLEEFVVLLEKKNTTNDMEILRLFQTGVYKEKRNSEAIITNFPSSYSLLEIGNIIH